MQINGKKLPEAGWLNIKEISAITENELKVSTLKLWCRKNDFGEFQRVETGNGGNQYQIHLYSPRIPYKARVQFLESNPSCAAVQAPTAEISIDSELYSSAPAHARRKADKYLNLINLTEGLSGKALRDFVSQWNHTHPDDKTSYARLMDARKNYSEAGLPALLGRWGHRAGATSVDDRWFDYFRDLYLKEGAPGVMICWRMTLGYAKSVDPHLDAKEFPSHMAFHRRLQREMLPEAVYAARYGAKKANRKYSMHIKRDYSDILAGEVWVSDHAQIDVATSYIDNQGRMRYCFPWVTVWRDFKSGVWLGWIVRPDAPSSDPIFSAFYRAGTKYGIGSYAYLDNGKDYRCKAFSGGRTRVNVTIDEANTRSLLGSLQIQTIFAWPYNAQSKPVERDFLRNKEWLSKNAAGYRGGNVVERPEALNDRIKKGEIEDLNEFERLFNTFVTDIINVSVVNSGHRQGMCPMEIWEKESHIAAEKGLVRTVSDDALKLFCSRTSRDMTVGRRGVHDSELGVDYYSDWMMAYKGTKVYLRRDPLQFQAAWVFDAKTDDYLGKGDLLAETPALARTDIERSQLQHDISVRRRAGKIVRDFARTSREIPLSEKVGNLVRATNVLNEARGYSPSEQTSERANILVTQMDRVMAEEKRRQRIGTQEIPILTRAEECRPKRKLYKLPSERDEDLAQAAEG